MKRLWRYLFVLLLSAGMWTGCDLFKYHPYAGKFEGARHLTRTHLERLQQEPWQGAVRFAFISDTQRWYDDTDDAVASINARGDIDFVLHGGDMTDFGLTEEFVWMRDCLLDLRCPWLSIIGNHDYLGNGEHIYKEMFGPYNYAFTIGHTRFEMLNTVALELDYSTPVPDFSFLESEILNLNLINKEHPDSIRRTVVVMHSRPGDEQFNNNASLPFDRYLQLFPGMSQADTLANGQMPSFCLNGHNHRNETLQPYGDGILFHGVCEIKDRQYFVITLNEDNSYALETVDF